jgi:site-specific DNA-methyltransferase (adenine-specific)
MFGDCLDLMKTIEPKTVDLIATDLPYGTTACKWDIVIPFESLWKETKRILRPNGVFVTTSTQPFTSLLITSNLNWYKFCGVWNKKNAGNYQLAKKQPLKIHEDYVVFSPGKGCYYPQMTLRDKPIVKGGNKCKSESSPILHAKEEFKGKVYTHKYPESIVYFPTRQEKENFHPTQKPILFYEYIIKTYSEQNSLVLDLCMGSGTTGEACINTKRNFIGIENHRPYYDIAEKRILGTAVPNE